MTTSSRLRRLMAVPVLVGALLGGVAAAEAPGPPPLAAELGGPLHAALYASGMEVAPDGTLVIADTGNNQVAKYDQVGDEIWRVGGPGSGTGQFLRPRDVSVASDGTIFVVDTENERIVRLDGDGVWLDVVDTPARYFLGGTFSDDRYYLADIQRKVRVLDVAGTELQVITENGACANMADIRDATASSDGRVYVAAYDANAIYVFGADGTCLDTFGSTGSGEGEFRTPYGVATAVDPVLGEEVLYVADAQNDRVQVFQLDGTFVSAFGEGGPPTTPGTLTTLRRVAPAVDGSGDAWVADLWGWRIERWARTASGWEFAAQFGAGPGTAGPSAVFHENRGLAVDAIGTMYVMDSVHHQMVVMAPDGSILQQCGSRGSGDGEFNWPRDVDIDEATGELWITDTKFNRLQILQPDCQFVAKRGSAGDGDAQFDWPRAVAIRQSDRTAWFADTQNHRVVVWDIATRQYVGSFGTGHLGSSPTQLARPMGIAVDQATGHVFVADTFNDRIAELSAGPGGTDITLVQHIAAGLDRPEALDVGPDGLLYVADTADDEIVVLDAAGAVAFTLGGGDGLDHPSGITVDAEGRVYVSDSFHDRVLVYSDVPLPPVDGEAPDATVSSPVHGGVVSGSPVVFSGVATDDVSVVGVRVAVRDTASLLWWDGGGWQAGYVTLDAVLDAPGAVSTGWSLAWEPPVAGMYALQVIADDAAGRSDPSKPWVPFQVDGEAPDATVSSPVHGGVVSGPPVVFSGVATDDVSVVGVRVAVRDTASLLWWDGGGWQAGYVTLDAVLDAPGAVSTGWSLAWEPPVAGMYALQVIADDAAGRSDPSKPWVPFQVDGEAPDATVSSPVHGGVVSGPPVVFSGVATDDVSVVGVRVAVRDTASLLWWDGGGWQAGFVTLDAVLDAPGAVSTGWSLAWEPPVAGMYALQVIADDAAGRSDPSKPWVPFQVV